MLQLPLGRFLSHVIQFSTLKLSPSETLTAVKWTCAQASDPSVVTADGNNTVQYICIVHDCFDRANRCVMCAQAYDMEMPLFAAAAAGNLGIVQYLVDECGADCDLVLPVSWIRVLLIV